MMTSSSFNGTLLIANATLCFIQKNNIKKAKKFLIFTGEELISFY